MKPQPSGIAPKQRTPSAAIAAVLAGSERISRRWPGLRVEYAWRPPFEGAAKTKPNRVEVVFSAHADVAIELAGKVRDIEVQPGAMYVVGAEPTTLLKVGEYSDTLEMYPEPALLREAAEWANVSSFELESTLGGERSATFRRDAAVLGVAHVLRRACTGGIDLPDIEAETLAHLLAERMLSLQYGGDPAAPKREGRRLGQCVLGRIADHIEDNLTRSVTLGDLAAVAGLSPFHFARCFKSSTGLAPHRYVLARRIELAKRRILTTGDSVQDIAWSIGFENVSHFRRQFAAQIGVLPGELRRRTRI